MGGSATLPSGGDGVHVDSSVVIKVIAERGHTIMKQIKTSLINSLKKLIVKTVFTMLAALLMAKEHFRILDVTVSVVRKFTEIYR